MFYQGGLGSTLQGEEKIKEERRKYLVLRAE